MSDPDGALTDLNNAVRSGNIEVVKKWLADHPEGKDTLNKVSGNPFTGGLSPLMVACQLPDHGQRENMIELLLKEGANVNLQDWQGCTALMKAIVEVQPIETAVCLLRTMKERVEGYSINLELQNHDCATALMIACKQGSLEKVKLLLESGAQVNVVGKLLHHNHRSQEYHHYIEKSPLVIATENGHSAIVKELLEKGAKVAYENSDALTMACDKENIDLVTILLANESVDVNFRSRNGDTPLMIASMRHSTEIVRLLLEKSAKVGLQGNNGESALTNVIYSHASTEMIKLLLSHCTKDDVNLKTNSGDTALMLAIQQDRSENLITVAEMFLENGADVKLQNKEGETALMLALKDECRRNGGDVFKLVKLLLDHGAQINYKKKLYYHSLFHHDWVEISKLLIERDVNFGALANYGETTLLAFTKHERPDIVKLCLNKWPEDVNAFDAEGKYPLWFAVQRGNFELFELLLDKSTTIADKRPNNEKSALEMLKNDNDLLTSFLLKSAEKKNCKLFEFLLSCGANAMTVDSSTGKSALKMLQDGTPIMEMIDSEPEKEYPNLKQLIMSHPEIMGHEEKLVPADLPNTELMETSELNDVEKLQAVSDGVMSESDQFSARKRKREGSTNEVDIQSKISRVSGVNGENTEPDDTIVEKRSDNMEIMPADKSLLGPVQPTNQCPICEENIDDISDSIVCTGQSCNGPVHRQCAGLSRKAFECASNSQFTCLKCDFLSLKQDVSAMKQSKKFTLAPRKKFTIIVQGIKESEAPAIPTRQGEDLAKVISVLSKVDGSIQPQAIKDHHRLGKYSDQARQRPRPILVQFLRSADVSSILSKTSAVESSYSIQHYMTPTELARNKILLKKRWAIHTETGTDLKLIKIRKHSTCIYVDDRLHGSLNTTTNQYQPISHTDPPT